jgi:hypothetical protein
MPGETNASKLARAGAGTADPDRVASGPRCTSYPFGVTDGTPPPGSSEYDGDRSTMCYSQRFTRSSGNRAFRCRETC